MLTWVLGPRSSYIHFLGILGKVGDRRRDSLCKYGVGGVGCSGLRAFLPHIHDTLRVAIKCGHMPLLGKLLKRAPGNGRTMVHNLLGGVHRLLSGEQWQAVNWPVSVKRFFSAARRSRLELDPLLGSSFFFFQHWFFQTVLYINQWKWQNIEANMKLSAVKVEAKVELSRIGFALGNSLLHRGRGSFWIQVDSFAYK